MTADRPAAELLAEIVPMFAEDRRKGRTLSVWADAAYVYALRRLVRAEQALADIKKLHTLGDDGFCTRCGLQTGTVRHPVRHPVVYPCETVCAALRASQGDQS